MGRLPATPPAFGHLPSRGGFSLRYQSHGIRPQNAASHPDWKTAALRFRSPPDIPCAVHRAAVPPLHNAGCRPALSPDLPHRNKNPEYNVLQPSAVQSAANIRAENHTTDGVPPYTTLFRSQMAFLPRHAFSQRSGIFKDILVSRQSHGLTPAAVSAGRSPTRRPAARRLPRASA